MLMINKEFSKYLAPTSFIDCDNSQIVTYAHSLTRSTSTTVEMAINLYKAVRDDVRYDPYNICLDLHHLKASYTLQLRKGYCVSKAILLAAACRAVGIPCRLRFADVKNHLSTKRLRRRMGTDLFVYHGYNELYLNGRWVKATPTFNRSLCEKFNIKPLDFDGINDSILHPYDMNGNKHLEYVYDHGVYDDVPLNEIIESFKHHYPTLTFDGKMNIKDEFEDEASPL